MTVTGFFFFPIAAVVLISAILVINILLDGKGKIVSRNRSNNNLDIITWNLFRLIRSIRYF